MRTRIDENDKVPKSGLNRTEQRRADRFGSNPPLSMNDTDREEDGEKYRTDYVSVGSIGNDAGKIKSGLSVLFDLIADLYGRDDPSTAIALGGCANRVFKSLLSGDPNEAAEKLYDIASTAKELSETMGELAGQMDFRWGVRNSFNKAADRRKLPESTQLPFDGASITEMRLLGDDFDA